MSSSFVHLHFHTNYSLLDGAILVKGLSKTLKEKGYNSCAITDHGNLHGAIEFHHEMKKEGLKPIIGMEAYVARIHRKHRSYPKPGPNAYHTVLLCQNREGYQNLIKLASLGFEDGKYYGKPRIDHELLEKYNKGLIVLSACINGELAKRMLEGDIENAKKTAQWYADLFPNRYYIELQANGLPEQNKVNPQLIQLARELKIPLVGTNDCHYPAREDAEAHHILQLMGWQKKVTDPDVRGLNTSELFIKTPDEMIQSFSELPSEAIHNTAIIADQCELDLTCTQYFLPDYPVQENRTLEEELIRQSQKGLEERLEFLKTIYNWDEEQVIANKERYQKRLLFELGVINDMGFPGYFLIVADFINWSKQQEIPVGPGRGSGAGSIVAYSLKITDIDPIRYDLLFERFLNPSRVSMPDFDIDFEVEGRERVIEYVREKYGRKNVCQISAIGSLQAKGALRGVARVLDVPYADADKIAKLIPDELGITLRESFKKEPRLAALMENGSEREQKLVRIALSLEGLNNNLSTHAAGVIIMNAAITDVMPTCTPAKGDGIQSMYTMKYAEDQGAVKFDFLGLKNLTIIDKAVKLINHSLSEKEHLRIDRIPVDNQKTYDLFSRGDTTGIFQLESEGMKGLIRKLKPDCFEDIIALVALYRPGPLGSGMVDDFVERKHGRQEIVYPHPQMEALLEETYGVMVYQEQVMRTVQVLANFSLGDADLLRRAIGKKIPEVLQQQRQKFIDGCKANEIDSTLANKLFDLIDKFAGYGFNKSHSAAYALISYQTAWLKANYPVEFMAALLTTERNNSDKVVKLISECSDMNIHVLPPDINESELIFTAHGKNIRFGLNAIKNVGEAALASILKGRKEFGEFKDLLDILTKIDTSKVNARVLESLIKAGVFDSIEANRKKITQGLEKALKLAADGKLMVRENQVSFFQFLPENEEKKSTTQLHLPDVQDWKAKIRLKYEKETLGFYISGHPLDPYFKEITKSVPLARSFDLKSESQDNPPTSYKKQIVFIAGVVSNMIVRLNKQNQRWAAITLEDKWGSIEVVIFAKVFKNVEAVLESDEPILIRGSVNNRNDVTNIVAESIASLPRIRAEKAVEMFVDLTEATNTSKIIKFRELLQQYPGNCSVRLNVVTKDQCSVRIALEEKVSVDERLIEELEEIVSDDALFFQYKQENLLDQKEGDSFYET